MSKKAVVWIRDDFRIKNNSALSYATNNYDTVTALYIYNNKNFDDVREAQKWWVSKSLINFKDELIKYNIELELVFSDEITFFSKIKDKQEISIFWNKIYEPSQLKLDNDLIKIFEKNKILSKCFKGNVLNEYNNVTKDDGSPYKVYSPFWRVGEQIYLDSIPSKSLNVKKVKSKIKLFKNNNVPDQILPKKNWYKKFEKYWGMTGYPIVDAGMRQLYETGWMHNRIRMVVGSFLVKHLRINWKEGEKHFRNCLLDFNEANNVAQWQWVAGCGADAAPYFRIFNPILQGEKFDKQGLYVKKWVPELERVPSKFIHKPWEMETKYQEAIKTKIGSDYPSPIVVHEEARNAALKAFQTLKN